MDDSCAVCADTLEWVAYGSCGHRDVCSTCVARLRFICDDRRCCICKTDSQVVFVTKAMGDYTKMVNDFSILPTQLREGKVGAYWYHEDTQAFFDDAEHYKMIRAMCRLSCSVCDKEEIAQQDGPRKRQRFRNIGQLKGHLSHQHRLFMCDLCLEGRKVFICEQKLYSRAQLNQHKRTGDSEVDGSESERGGFAGHPMCEFCRSSFYGENELYSHMSTEHYTCHICQRQNPGQYEYYKDYDDLETHFRHGHFLCEDEACLVKKFIVFQSEAELKRHNALEHGGRMSRSKRNAVLQIPTSFRYRSSNESGFHRGRRRSFRRESSPDHELSQAIEASLIRVNASDPVAGPPASTAAETPESNDIDSLVQPFDSLSTTDSSRYRQAVSQISTNASLGETSFPPLSTGPSSSQQKSQQESQNSMAARLRRKNKATVLNVGQSRPANSHGSALATSAAWPAPNVGQSRPANSRGSASATSAAWPAPAPSDARPAPLHVSSSSSGPRKPSSANSSGTFTATASSAAWPAPLHVSSSSSGPRKPSTANSSGTSTAPANSAAWPAPLNVPSSSSGLRKPDTANGSGTSSYAKSVHNRPVNEPGLAEGSSWGSRNLGSANRLSHSNSAPNLVQSKSVDQMSEFPPVSAAAAALAQPNKKIEDVQTANKSLVERMRAALDYDENKFSAFREISQEYRQGSVGTWEYLQYVKQFGLTHLVIDLARLCPDTRKQEELIEAYNSTCQSNGAQEPFWGNGNLNSSGSSSSRKNKGKKVVDAETSSSKEALADSVISTVKSLQSQWKPSDGEVEVLEKDGYRSTRGISAGSGGEMLVELHGRNRNLPAQATGGTAVPTSGDGGSKQKKKTSKFHRIRLGDGSAAALLDVRNSSDPSSADTTSGWPKPSEGSSARSVWGNGAGQKLFAK